MIYSQRDEQWKDKQLGESGLDCGHWGCTVTATAQAITDAGYEVSPGQLIDALNANDGFTADGLIKWAKVTEVYPQFHIVLEPDGSEPYRLQKGHLGKWQHWVLKDADGIKDPLYGVANEPAGFVETVGSRGANIDPAPQPEPVVEIPVEVWPKTIEVTSDIGVYVRQEPNRQALIVDPDTHLPYAPDRHGGITKGGRFQAVELVDGEDVDGNNKWWKSEFGNYVWSGATEEVKE